jgi:basic amino acid/polyamine antiporter, APA family
VARKLPRLQRVLDAPALFSVAYGEIASSIYFALGVIALYALGFTPFVLLLAGALFLLVSLSYAEGTTAIRETGGAATFVRRAFNDLAGFMTGWVLFLDYLIVMALSALSVPHYLGAAFHLDGLRDDPWDVVAGVAVIAAIAAVRLVRRARLYSFVLVVAIVDLVTQLLLVGLGFALVLSPDALTRGFDVGRAPGWSELAFALPLAFLAYTGLETVANLAEETRRPGRDLPRSLFSAIVLVVGIYVAIALVGMSAFPVERGSTALATEWLEAPLMGIVDAVGGDLPGWLAAALRVYVGLTAMLILVVAATASISGFARLAYSLGEHGQLPRLFGKLHRRTLVAPQSIVAAALISSALLVGASALPEDPITSLASLFSFGILLAFAAAQVAVVRLRFTAPELRRPFRVPFDVRLRGADVPVPTLIGLVVTVAIWIVALATHPGARYGGPLWLALGLVVYVVVRRRLGQPLTARVISADEHELTEPKYQSILVPMKLGPIGEEMVATGVKLAQESGARIEALYVIAVPLDLPLDAELADQQERALASLGEARALGADHGVEVETVFCRGRSIGSAIIDEARRKDVDLIVLGSSPRWRRQSKFFSPTVEYVLKRAPCEVLIVAFPLGALEDEAAAV